MKAQQILASKPSGSISVKTDDLIMKAVDVLGEKNIGALLVHDEKGDLAGILSERDVVRRLSSVGSDALSLKVSDCMTPNPFTCSPEASVDEIMTTMTEKRIRHLPVMDNQKLVGVISIGDVVKRKIEAIEQEKEDLKLYIAS